MAIIGITFDEINEFLTQEITVESQVNTSDGKGGYITSYSLVETTYGRLVQISGTELDLFEKKYPDVRTKIYLKKGSTVDLDYRLTINSKYYYIREIKDPVSSEEFIICYVESNEK